MEEQYNMVIGSWVYMCIQMALIIDICSASVLTVFRIRQRFHMSNAYVSWVVI